MKKIIKDLQDAYKDSGKTIYAVAKASGQTWVTTSRVLELGQNVRFETIVAIADALDLEFKLVKKRE
jgi:DNA-binding phage protein